MDPSACFSPQELRDYSLGRLSEADTQRVEAHVRECRSCEETVAALDDATDSLLRQLKQPPVDSQYADDPVLQQALRVIESPLAGSAPVIDVDERDELASMSERPMRLRDYEVIGPLGHGGMGTVFRARHLRLQRDVALKLLPQRRLRDPAAIARFQREMQAIGQMDHPSIVRATDAGEENGQHYLAMELIDGVDLRRLTAHAGRLAPAAACELIRQAAVGLEYVHQRGIVHRDVKPSNLMLTARRHRQDPRSRVSSAGRRARCTRRVHHGRPTDGHARLHGPGTIPGQPRC